MKKHLLLTAMALVIAAPCYAQATSDTNVMKTETAVEKAARAQGFMSSGAPAAASPQVIENSSVMMMAPEAPADAEATPTLAPAPVASSYGSRPSLIKNDLPPGLVMNGPGTEAYKKKHRKKKKKAAVEQAVPSPVEAAKEEVAAEPAPAPVSAPELAPEPAPVPVAEPTPAPTEEPPLMPDANAIPPAPAPEPDFPMPAPDLGLPAPDETTPAPAPGSIEAPLDPFAAPDH